MTDQPSLKQFLDEMSSYSGQDGSSNASANAAVPPIGQVLEIAGLRLAGLDGRRR